MLVFNNKKTPKNRKTIIIKDIQEVPVSEPITDSISDPITDSNITDYNISDPITDPIIDSNEILSLLRAQIAGLVDSVNNNKIPYLDLNSMVKYINLLTGDSVIDLPEKNTSGIFIISDTTNNNNNIQLKFGNKIILTSRNFNLDLLKKEELIEILESIEDNITFDYLRTELTREIASRD